MTKIKVKTGVEIEIWIDIKEMGSENQEFSEPVLLNNFFLFPIIRYLFSAFYNRDTDDI